MSHRLLFCFYTLLFTITFPGTVSATDAKYIQIESPGTIRLTEDALYWEDTTNSLSIHEMLSRELKFGILEKNIWDLGFSPYTRWVRFKLENYGSTPREFFVLVDNSRIENLRGYVIHKDKIVKEYPATGWGTPFKERPFPFYKHILPVEIGPYQEVTIYISAYSKYHPAGTPISIWNYEKTYQNYYASIIGDGFFHIALLCAFLVSFFAFIDSSYREWSSFWYVCYSLNIFLYYFFKFGIQYFITDKIPVPFAYWIEIHIILFSVSYYFFGMTFMSSVPVNRKIRRYSYYILAFLTIICLLSYLVKYEISGKIILLWRGAITVTILSGLFYTIVVGLKKRDRYAIFFVAMATPLIFMWAATIFSIDRRFLGGVFDGVILQKAIIAIETCLMLISVIYKNWQYKKALQSKISAHERQIFLTQLQTQNSERNRVAQDLHDDLGGIVATIASRLSRLKSRLPDSELRHEMESITDISQKAGERIRQIAHNLMPPEFEKAGLAESLREYVLGIGAPVFTFSAFGKERRFSPERELNLYRLVSELVQNIRKHAGATRADIQLFFHEELLSIVIENDGPHGNEDNGEREAAPAEAAGDAPAAGIGRTSIQTRLEYLRARLMTDTGETGTTVILEVPYDGTGETGSS